MTNRLANEKSPYLLQHAHNPVDWYPWGADAFQAAMQRDVPIFLSVGYSTCHWCHVMERESFEDEAVADFLNRNFVSIKVDREERPDLDEIYMSALQAINGSGGWPMSVFLTPELVPFYAGTYFPPRPSYGRPSFLQLLSRIHELWQNQRESIVESSRAVLEVIRNTRTGPQPSTDVVRAARNCYQFLENSYDREHGGFGSAPKFPRPVQFDFLLEYWHATGVDTACDMVTNSLRQMARGGLYDHLGGGFHRYSVDRYWRVSHFEKMLYDQAQLVNLLLDAWQITHDDIFSNAARGVCDYVLHDLTSPQGGYYSAEDADSEGEEGKYYVWTKQEIEQQLGNDTEIFLRRFGITPEGNFEHGKNVLHITQSLEQIAAALGVSVEHVQSTISEALASLSKHRGLRVRPHLDDKVLTSWNGLMISAMARAGAVLENEQYLESARTAADFVWKELRTDSLLQHRWRQGESGIPAMLDDYAFYISGLLTLHQMTLERVWLDRAIELQSEQDERLWDHAEGGYFTSDEARDLIVRRKNGYDGAEPSGNSLSALNLLTLAVLTEDEQYRARAETVVGAFGTILQQHPYAMPKLMTAAMRLSRPLRQVVLRGEPHAVREMRKTLHSVFLPDTLFLDGAASPGPFAAGLPSEGHPVTAYVCHDFVCELPVHDSNSLLNLLARSSHTATNA